MAIIKNDLFNKQFGLLLTFFQKRTKHGENTHEKGLHFKMQFEIIKRFQQ